MEKIVEITYLELERTEAPNTDRPLPDGFALVRMRTPQPEVNRFLYTAVGGAWYWVDQLGRTFAWWRDRVQAPGFETWLLMEEGSIAGYFELEPKGGDVLELAYFGLLPPYVDRGGLGGPLLRAAIGRAWEAGANRLQVETCSLDHPAALANYRARGFRVVRTATHSRTLPDEPVGPWPGCGSSTADR
ncbi:MAG: GNAT family N-acetyltransferase [Armatimonadota bacterium]